MPIGVVSDDEFELEIENGNRSPVPSNKPAQIPPVSDPLIIDINRGGRSPGDQNVPEVLREIIGTTAAEDGRAAALQFAKMVGVSDSSVSAYSNGATSTATYNNPNKKLSDKLKASKMRVAVKARNKLNLAIEHITEEKLENANLKDLALVAKSMSGVIKDMEPSVDNGHGGLNLNGPSIVMYNPGFAKESSFETVDVND
jgi:hypothetical protein